MISSHKKLKIIDLFAGVGGLTYGFYHNDRFQVVAANELLPNMARAYSLNHPGVKMYCEDIKDFGLHKLTRDLGIKKGEIDIVVGGPPCQAYSTVGKRLLDDPRGKLFQQYYRLLGELGPRFFVFENVKGLLSMQKGELLKTIVDLFESLGYKVNYQVLNAADYGAPQFRERIIITGTKSAKSFEYPKPTHGPGLNKYLTLADAISDLPFIDNGEESFGYSGPPINAFQKSMRLNSPAKLMDHNAPKNNDRLVLLMKHLPDGGTPKYLPVHLRPSSGFGNTYSRLWWNKPATTITRNLGTPSSSRCVHPKANRALTTREGARLQCFPDNYKFFGSRSDRNLQIGNAVPTVLSEALSKAILEYHENAY